MHFFLLYKRKKVYVSRKRHLYTINPDRVIFNYSNH